MSEDYTYQPSERPDFAGVLTEGDYDFVVTEANEMYRSDKGNLVLPVKLAVGKQRVTVFDSPSAGKNKNGEAYDRIANFLEAIGKAPQAGQKANLGRKHLEGSKGRARIKVEVATMGKLAGKDVNKVHYYISPVSASASPAVAAGQDNEPDDIPF
jgi:hypothetical protein